MASSIYKLTYFAGKGRGEPLRFLFAAAKVPYEDIRVDFEGSNWNQLKPKTPWGELPTLDVDGQVLAQSNAILRYLGKRFNLAGDNEFEAAKCDEIVEAMMDFSKPMWEMIMESDEEKKKDKMDKLIADSVPKYFGKWDELINQNQGFLVGKRLSLADIDVASLLNFYNEKLGGHALDKYPLLSAHHDMVHNSPGIKEWVAKRPQTPW